MQIILAIAPGKRELGIAVFGGTELVYFAVRSLRNGRTERLLKIGAGALIRELTAAFKPQAVVVKTTSQYQKASSNARLILKVIKREAAANQISTLEVSLKKIKAALCKDENPTLGEVFQNLTVLYPELKQYLNRPSKWQTEYYHNLFSAVAVGVTYFKRH